jgi:hypothetical protein
MWRVSAGLVQAGKNEVYAITEERVGSKDHILGGKSHGTRQITCTAEVFINNEGKDYKV